ncbi:UNVERIFIED_CONTAM: hypothetical protein Sradi_4342300 [Sesamum radiatum]|uniref:Uncharacterized protein n=1 Tax=Sesamum radiatum TaxID=300843 RepID=A0AAW2NNP6_SESRA
MDQVKLHPDNRHMNKLRSMKKSCHPINKPHHHPRKATPPPPPNVPPQEAMIQLTQEALLALIRDASTRAAAQAIAQCAAQHPVNLLPPSPRRSRELFGSRGGAEAGRGEQPSFSTRNC